MTNKLSLPAIPVPTRRQRQVHRYSRLVTWFKIMLPLTGILLVAAIFLSGRDRGSITDLLSPQELARLSAGLRLENPRFSGVLESGENYTLRAKLALPDGANPKRIRFRQPTGEIALDDGRVLTARSNKGIMNRRTEILILTGNVVLNTSDGYRFTSKKLTLDLGEHQARSDSAVAGEGPAGEIQAGSFRAAQGKQGNKDATLWFENGVRVVFIPSKEN